MNKKGEWNLCEQRIHHVQKLLGFVSRLVLMYLLEWSLCDCWLHFPSCVCLTHSVLVHFVHQIIRIGNSAQTILRMTKTKRTNKIWKEHIPVTIKMWNRIPEIIPKKQHPKPECAKCREIRCLLCYFRHAVTGWKTSNII